MMKRLLTLGLAAAFAAAPAHGQTNDTFDGEAGGGQTILNYTSLANFDIVQGSVDLLFDPNGFGPGCAGGSGSCIDLDGSTGQGGLLRTKNSLAFAAGDTVRLSFDVAGNGRGAGTDLLRFGFQFAGNTSVGIADITTGGGFGDSVFPGPLFAFGTFGNIQPIAADAPFTTYTFSFRTLQAGSLKGIIGAPLSTDNQGPILDNYSLSIAVVPEPATWALMILGFGAVGAALRRRSGRVALA